MMDDDDVVLHLQCDVEMQLTGPTDAVLNKWAADALRRLANSIENEGLEDGWHELKDNVGKPIGKVYVSYEGEII